MHTDMHTHIHTHTTSVLANYAKSQQQLAGIRGTKLALPSHMVPGLCEPSWSLSWNWKPPIITSITAKDLATIEHLSLQGLEQKLGHGYKHSSSQLHFV